MEELKIEEEKILKIGEKQIYISLSIWFTFALFFGFFEIALFLPIWLRPLMPIVLTLLGYSIFKRSLYLKVKVMDYSTSQLVAVLVITRFLAPLGFFIYDFPSNFNTIAVIGNILFVTFGLFVLLFQLKLFKKQLTLYYVFNIFGIIQLSSVQLLVAFHIGTGKAGNLIHFTSLPMNFLPSFIVPLSFVIHFVIFHKIKQTGAIVEERISGE